MKHITQDKEHSQFCNLVSVPVVQSNFILACFVGAPSGQTPGAQAWVRCHAMECGQGQGEASTRGGTNESTHSRVRVRSPETPRCSKFPVLVVACCLVDKACAPAAITTLQARGPTNIRFSSGLTVTAGSFLFVLLHFRGRLSPKGSGMAEAHMSYLVYGSNIILSHFLSCSALYFLYP